MKIFGEQRSYNTIVAPLQKMEKDLSEYMGEQGNRVANLQNEKDELDKDIANSQLEIKKSRHTSSQIASLLATDFDEDMEADIGAPPEEPDNQDTEESEGE